MDRTSWPDILRSANTSTLGVIAQQSANNLPLRALKGSTHGGLVQPPVSTWAATFFAGRVNVVRRWHSKRFIDARDAGSGLDSADFAIG